MPVGAAVATAAFIFCAIIAARCTGARADDEALMRRLKAARCNARPPARACVRACVRWISRDSAGYSWRTQPSTRGYSQGTREYSGVLRTCRPRATLGAPAAVSTGVCDAWPLAIRATCSVSTHTY